MLIPPAFSPISDCISQNFAIRGPIVGQNRIEGFAAFGLAASGELRMKHRITTNRNREIFLDFRAGKTSAELAALYGLSRASIVAIVCVEKHRLEVCEDSFYQQLRASLGIEPYLGAAAAE